MKIKSTKWEKIFENGAEDKGLIIHTYQGPIQLNFKKENDQIKTWDRGSEWGTRVHPWWIHVDVCQNRYKIVK